MAIRKVMIVEDDPLHMKLFNDLLECQGYETVRTADGEKAVEIARQHRPDLIVLDIRLPGVSGLDVVREIKNDGDLKDIPVIAVTALADKWERDEYLRHGFDGFLAKPIAVPNFLRLVAGFLDPMPYSVAS